MLLDNETPFAADRFAVSGPTGADVLLVVVKATFTYGRKGTLTVAEEQLPVETADRYNGDPAESSIAYASDFALGKMGTDVALLGHAYPLRPGDTSVNAGIQVGPVQKVVKVFGDRFWMRAMGLPRISRPAPFERIPLVYERAFGGTDRSHPEEKHHQWEPRNPVGTGFRARKSQLPVEDRPLPNIEHPHISVSHPDDRPEPASLGFIGPSWQPRVSYAGTYDEAWERNRKPLLPDDFNVQFFNAAHPELVSRGFLKGNEEVVAIGVSPDGPIELALPGLRLGVTIEGSRAGIVPIGVHLDKVVLEPDERRLVLVWSGSWDVKGSIRDVERIRCNVLN